MKKVFFLFGFLLSLFLLSSCTFLGIKNLTTEVVYFQTQIQQNNHYYLIREYDYGKANFDFFIVDRETYETYSFIVPTICNEKVTNSVIDAYYYDYDVFLGEDFIYSIEGGYHEINYLDKLTDKVTYFDYYFIKRDFTGEIVSKELLPNRIYKIYFENNTFFFVSDDESGNAHFYYADIKDIITSWTEIDEDVSEVNNVHFTQMHSNGRIDISYSSTKEFDRELYLTEIASESNEETSEHQFSFNYEYYRSYLFKIDNQIYGFSNIFSKVKKRAYWHYYHDNALKAYFFTYDENTNEINILKEFDGGVEILAFNKKYIIYCKDSSIYSYNIEEDSSQFIYNYDDPDNNNLIIYEHKEIGNRNSLIVRMIEVYYDDNIIKIKVAGANRQIILIDYSGNGVKLV